MSNNLVFLLKSEDMKGQFSDWADSICLAIKIKGQDDQMEYLIFHDDELNEKLLSFYDGLPVVPEIDGFETGRILFATETQILKMISEERSLPELSHDYLLNYNWSNDELSEEMAEPELETNESLSVDVPVEENDEFFDLENSKKTEELIKDDDVYIANTKKPSKSVSSILDENRAENVSIGQYFKTYDEVINEGFYALRDGQSLVLASNNPCIQNINTNMKVLFSENDHSVLLPISKSLKLEMGQDSFDSDNKYLYKGIKFKFLVKINFENVFNVYESSFSESFQRVIIIKDSLGYVLKIPNCVGGEVANSSSVHKEQSSIGKSNSGKNTHFNYVPAFISIVALAFTFVLYQQVTSSFDKINMTLDNTSVNLKKLNDMTELKSDLNPIYLNNMRDRLVDTEETQNEDK